MLALSSRLDRLPAITHEMVKREFPEDTYARRARRANLIYQASRCDKLMDLYNPYIANVLLRHASTAIESYQSCLVVRGVVKGPLFSQVRREQLVRTWQGTPRLEEYTDKKEFPLWPNMSAEEIQASVELWWRAEIINAVHIEGFEEDLFARRFRHTHEKKVVSAIAKRVQESIPMVFKQSVISEYVKYLVCLAYREGLIHEQSRRELSVLANNDDHTRANTSPAHEAY